ncbi:hypothetical protein PMSM_11580 [Paenibacillus macquariensis subsp. macquariensis]|nr:hypothetical protein PMSM_11580 [Paenibacillus macquariensis subsp. macquariensis]
MFVYRAYFGDYADRPGKTTKIRTKILSGSITDIHIMVRLDEGILERRLCEIWEDSLRSSVVNLIISRAKFFADATWPDCSWQRRTIGISSSDYSAAEEFMKRIENEM